MGLDAFWLTEMTDSYQTAVSALWRRLYINMSDDASADMATPHLQVLL